MRTMHPRPSPADLKRFLSKVHVLDTFGCWEWKAGLTHDGYGRFKLNGRTVRAHRVAVDWIGDGADDDASLLHSCDNPKCVNPSHLRPGTHAENMVDMVARGRSAKGDRHGARLHPETRPRGDSHHMRARAPLGMETAKKVRALKARGLTQDAIAAELNMSQGHVSNILSGKYWPESGV